MGANAGATLGLLKRGSPMPERLRHHGGVTWTGRTCLSLWSDTCRDLGVASCATCADGLQLGDRQQEKRPPNAPAPDCELPRKALHRLSLGAKAATEAGDLGLRIDDDDSDLDFGGVPGCDGSAIADER